MIFKTLKSLVPVFILLSLSLYGYQQHLKTPLPIINTLTYLPVILAVFVAALALHFNRSSIFLITVLLVVVNLLLNFKGVPTKLHYGLLAVFSPLLLLFFSIIPERSLLSFRSTPVYLVI
ncbi:MAG: hypothetical protein GQ532_14480 [Methylomarinum sp.]|nr:hypothetical protein [Methylomarinum sp.]